MIRLEMKNCDMILIEKQLKYWLNHQETYLRVFFTLLLSDLHSILVNVYFRVCNMFLHFKCIFENICLISD